MARKPTIVIQAINQAAREGPKTVERFLESVERLKRAQVTGTRVHEATQAQREALKPLLDRAQVALAESGYEPRPDVIRRLTATVLGAAADREGRADLQRGRLTREFAVPGFGAFAGAPRLRLVTPKAPAAEPAREPGRAERREPKRRGPGEPKPARRREEIRAAREAERAAERNRLAAARRVSMLERSASKHRRAADAADRAAQELRERLETLEQRAAMERRAAEQASEEAKRARNAMQR